MPTVHSTANPCDYSETFLSIMFLFRFGAISIIRTVYIFGIPGLGKIIRPTAVFLTKHKQLNA